MATGTKKITVRLRSDIYEALRLQAFEDRKTMTHLIHVALSKFLMIQERDGV